MQYNENCDQVLFTDYLQFFMQNSTNFIFEADSRWNSYEKVTLKTVKLDQMEK